MRINYSVTQEQQILISKHLNAFDWPAALSDWGSSGCPYLILAVHACHRLWQSNYTLQLPNGNSPRWLGGAWSVALTQPLVFFDNKLLSSFIQLNWRDGLIYHRYTKLNWRDEPISHRYATQSERWTHIPPIHKQKESMRVIDSIIDSS